jgi:hypothetical protein
VWRLTAANAGEASAITARLQAALDESYPRSVPAPSFDSQELETETDVLLSRSGGMWLVKKGEGLGAGDKRRLFVPAFGRSTRALKLNYYAECNSGVPADKKGCIVVTPFSDVSTTGANIVIVRFVDRKPLCACMPVVVAFFGLLLCVARVDVCFAFALSQLLMHVP